jgi:hypothetical protein
MILLKGVALTSPQIQQIEYGYLHWGVESALSAHEEAKQRLTRYGHVYRK